MTLLDVLPIAQQLSFADKLSLIRILAEELDQAASSDVTLIASHAHPIYTPLNQFGAAQPHEIPLLKGQFILAAER